MKINHIGLDIYPISEVTAFYTDLLGMHLVRKFTLTPELNLAIFGHHDEVEVYVVEKEKVRMELFLSQHRRGKSLQHICLDVFGREALAEKAQKAGYAITRVVRPGRDLIFIKDKSGNIFELFELETTNK